MTRGQIHHIRMLGRDYHNLLLLGVIRYLFEHPRPSRHLLSKGIILIDHIPLDLLTLVVNHPYRLNRLHLVIHLSRTTTGRTTLGLHRWKTITRTNIRVSQRMVRYNHRPNQLESLHRIIKVISHGTNRLNLPNLQLSNMIHHHLKHNLNLITIHISSINSHTPLHHRQCHPIGQLLHNPSPRQGLQWGITPLTNCMPKNLLEIHTSHLNRRREGVHHNLLLGSSKRLSRHLEEVHLNHLLGNNSSSRGQCRLNHLYPDHGNSSSNRTRIAIRTRRLHSHSHSSTISDILHRLLLRVTRPVRIPSNRLHRTHSKPHIPLNRTILRRGINP